MTGVNVGKAWQRTMREKIASEEVDLFGSNSPVENPDIKTAVVKEIDNRMARQLILKYEWLGTMSNAPIAAYGIFFDGHLAGCVVYGSPSPPIIAKSVIGEAHRSKVIQLGRGACVHWAHPHSASKLISGSLKLIEQKGYRVVVAFSDPTAGEIGTVYQASNWLYCGLTAVRPDYINSDGKRMVGHFQVEGLTRVPRIRKRRYVYILGSKQERRFYRKHLLWPVQPYEKRIAAGL